MFGVPHLLPPFNSDAMGRGCDCVLIGDLDDITLGLTLSNNGFLHWQGVLNFEDELSCINRNCIPPGLAHILHHLEAYKDMTPTLGYTGLIWLSS